MIAAASIALLLLLAAPPTAPIEPHSLTTMAQPHVEQGKLTDLSTRAAQALREQLADPAQADLDVLVRNATAHELGNYFGRVGEIDEGGRETLVWLVKQPELAITLLMLTGDYDPPDRVLEVLRVLRSDHRSAAEESPELAAAFCVTWDQIARLEADEDAPLDAEALVAAFDHFHKQVLRRRPELRKAPAELLTYVVDVELTEEELRWAGRRFGGAVNVAAVFAAVPYSDGVPYNRAAQADNDENAYLLPNLLKRGGNLADAAHVATQAARLSGVPAAICLGAGAGGGSPVAWVATFQPGARGGWNFNAARQREHAAWRGEIIDPQTAEWLSEAEVALLPRLLATPARDRLAARALVKSASFIALEKRLPIYQRAIELSPADRRTWLALADLAAAQKFDADEAQPIEDLIKRHLGPAHADFATTLRLRMLRGRGPIEFERGAQRAADAVKDRPELRATVQLALADRQMEQRQWKDADATLSELLRRIGTTSPPLTWQVISRLDEVLHRLDDLPRLAAIYREVMKSLPRPNSTRHGRTTPYFRIGARFALVLDDLNETQQAAQVRALINSVVRAE